MVARVLVQILLLTREAVITTRGFEGGSRYVKRFIAILVVVMMVMETFWNGMGGIDDENDGSEDGSDCYGAGW